MEKVLGFFKLLRPWQWYKNLLVFVPLVFVGRVFDLEGFLLSLFGFFALCLVSGFSYVVNDIIDVDKDRKNIEKKYRPIASGIISPLVAFLFGLVFLLAGFWLGFRLSFGFFLCLVALASVSLFYSFGLKNVAFLDIVIIGVNFVVRAASGAYIINVVISSWLVLCTFFLALVLAVGKRYGELCLLKSNANSHRATLDAYNKETAHALMVICSCLLLFSYSLYCFLSQHKGLFITLPFAVYGVFYYLSLVFAGSPIARHPELAFKDKKLVINMICWAIVSGIVLYVAL